MAERRRRIAVWPIAFALLCPVSFAQNRPVKAEDEELRKLRELRADPALAEARQDLLLKPFLKPAIEPDRVKEALALDILGTLRRPKPKTLDTLLSFLNWSPETRRAEYGKEHPEVLWALGRMGTSAKSVLHGINRMPIVQDGVAEAVQRISDITPPARTVVFAPDEAPESINGWTGTMSRVDKESVFLARNQQEWSAVWREHAGQSKAPEVLFPQYAVLAYFHGKDTCSSGFGRRAYEEFRSSETFTVTILHSEDCTSFPRYPFIMLLVRQPKVPLVVKKVSTAASTRTKREQVLAVFEP